MVVMQLREGRRGKGAGTPLHWLAFTIAAGDAWLLDSRQPVAHPALSIGSAPPAPSSARVLTVDDQELFRGVARDVINATPGFESIGEACSGEEALQAVERLAPDGFDDIESVLPYEERAAIVQGYAKQAGFAPGRPR